jgi:hypothetical protein
MQVVMPMNRQPPIDTRFKPGQSGNPSGRPAAIREVERLAREHSADAIDALAQIMRNSKSPPSARVSAAETLLNRAWGKPSQTVELNGEIGNSLVEVLASLSTVAASDAGEPATAAPVH